MKLWVWILLALIVGIALGWGISFAVSKSGASISVGQNGTQQQAGGSQ